MKKHFTLFFVFLALTSLGQTVPVGTTMVEDHLRRQQLLGRFDSAYSFNYRPIVFGKNGLEVDSTVFDITTYYKTISRPFNGKGVIKLLPVEIKMAYDHNFPDSRNDGAMIRSRGFQTLVSAGIYTEIGPLSIQIKPEFVWAENKEYEGFPLWPRHYESTWQTRYLWFNQIDSPEKYGNGQYTKILPGQSSIRLNKWGLSFGLSTENIWWGPGKRNSLMMSNNAQGFAHITFNTQKPIKTAIGSFEFQFLTGRLEASGFLPPGQDTPLRGRVAYSPKTDDWRQLQALTFSYSPKWIKGLTLGATRWVQQYNENAKTSGSYFPIFQNLFRKNDREALGFNLSQDQAAGFFGRWVWFDSNAEFYFEWGKNDASLNLRDLLVDTDHSRAFLVGINKLFLTSKKDILWQFNYEWIQTSQTESGLIRNARSWYIHSRVRHGYTNNGEILGSSLGPGGNAHYLSIARVKGLDRIGGSFERFVHNNDFAVEAFGNLGSPNNFIRGDFTRYWVDYNFTGFYEKRFNKLLLSASLMYTYSYNHQWEVLFDPNDPTVYPDTPGVDKNNWNFDLKLAYSF